ncbi:GNAT family N-acetyltransferase [Paenibacillus sp. RC67]|uniref:GNAT family N-acetyltransferase n=1 Tax=Paenibacillus sp. RC67 TaxID=3039392 RepID=UPI0024ADD7AD|nr:GNAT family N-acetyltransferase [Paenibacillus sp. RC67]
MSTLLAKDDRISIRLMKDTHEDYSSLLKWLNDEQVLRYIEGPGTQYTLEQIMDKYGPRARGEHYVTPCIIELDHALIGFLQFYPLQQEEIEAYEAKADKPQYGMDIFIGESDYWNQGIGTAALRLAIHHLLDEKGVEDIYIDPQTWNTRAIRSYEKCGFEKVKVLYARELFDGEYKDNQIMRLSSKPLTNV